MSLGKLSKYNKVTHCIFDLDGTLIDSESINDEINSEIISKFGKTYSDELKFKIRGTTERKSISGIINDLELPISISDYLNEFHELCRQRYPNVALMPGAENLLRYLKSIGVPIAVATSSSMDMVRIKTTNYKELFELFNHIVSGSDDPEVKNGKPAPDVFLVAAKRFPCSPSPCNCLVFEDAPNGVTAGKAAGMQVVMIPDPRVPEEKTTHATIVLRSLKDFEPKDFIWRAC
ncbi:HDHD1.2 family protein [Megaselia abdita]